MPVRMKRGLLLSIVGSFVALTALGQTPSKPADFVAAVKKRIADEVAKCPAPATPKKGRELCDTDEGAGRCAKWDPLISNKCVSQANNVWLSDITDYSLFGVLDCSVAELGAKTGKGSTGWKRDLKSITHVVVHQGGYSANGMVKNWLMCKGKNTDKDKETDVDASSAPHYVIERSGKIFQVVGEEYVTVHANSANPYSIGIEMNFIDPAKGPDCNQLTNRKKVTDDDAKRLCNPTPEQYKSLDRLISAIAMRTSVTRDNDHIIGHCEINQVDKYAHGDPRAFDWSKIGLSNQAKRDRLKTLKDHECEFYDVMP